MGKQRVQQRVYILGGYVCKYMYIMYKVCRDVYGSSPVSGSLTKNNEHHAEDEKKKRKKVPKQTFLLLGLRWGTTCGSSPVPRCLWAWIKWWLGFMSSGRQQHYIPIVQPRWQLQ